MPTFSAGTLLVHPMARRRWGPCRSKTIVNADADADADADVAVAVAVAVAARKPAPRITVELVDICMAAMNAMYLIGTVYQWIAALACILQE
ncbi:hypothetical protein O4H66_05885 [Comamonadaceae bacterium G21597-S1]|nr:hypothetical protein [Comamonadaceae bacterium G21597-S1]